MPKRTKFPFKKGDKVCNRSTAEEGRFQVCQILEIQPTKVGQTFRINKNTWVPSENFISLDEGRKIVAMVAKQIIRVYHEESYKESVRYEQKKAHFKRKIKEAEDQLSLVK